jgi:RNA polymerase sigma-70 factor (ECF subfamily)
MRAVQVAPTRPDPSPADDALVARAVDGDRSAFGDLVGRHQRRVWGVCRQYLGADEADAAAQDSFLKAYARLPTFDRRASFTTWLTRIAINTCLDQLRRRRRAGARVETTSDEGGGDLLTRLPDAAADPEACAIQRQAVRRLAECELQLPTRQRAIFRLRFYAELELEEVAGALGVSVGTVKTQLHRAVRRLRQELEAAR